MLEDLKGKKFGQLKVIRYDKEQKKWECLCDCGNTAYIATRNLKTGNTKSCGCLKNAKGVKRPRKNKNFLLYKDVGQLRVTDINEEKGVATCYCLECKKHTVDIPIDKLTEMYKSRKKSFTCGIDGCIHTRKTKNTNNRLSVTIRKGERFGNLVVLKRIENKKMKTKNSFSSIPVFLCRCDCGKETIVQGRYLLSGKTKSCGCQRGRKKIQTNKMSSNAFYSEDRQLLYNIFVKWKRKYKQPTKLFKEKVIDRGIKFFPEIKDEKETFEYFYQWSMLNNFSKTFCYLDRFDYSKDFSSKNCFWTNNRTKGY